MNSVYIIAEAGVNHNGSLDLALQLVQSAADAGANAVKFQTFFAENLVTKDAPRANYQKKNDAQNISQYEMLKRLELRQEDHFKLKAYAEEVGIEFLSTPFGLDELEFLVKRVKVKRLKMSSGEVTNGLLLLEAARTGLPIILSTGMSSIEEISDALGVLAFGYSAKSDAAPSMSAFIQALNSQRGQEMLRQNVTVLHCTTQYPTPVDDVNLRAMSTLAERFGLPVGYSDHTQGILASIAAAANGAFVLEKHFTLDRGMNGPDHAASLEPDELTDLVSSVRCVERMLGAREKGCSVSEGENIKVARKSLVVNKSIKRGAIFRSEHLEAKRPGGGLSPMALWDVLGKPANRDYLQDEQVDAMLIEDVDRCKM
ncbi:N-acetylneuraminate synthase [Thalassospira australica]|uniref:N-acetylneuraminate synthase n=1 Tax=Thalassospira australica TaxID=1528106 RepID=UPI00068BA741|nr:N-acetylneuraminate synthase [Thalassospira australica]